MKRLDTYTDAVQSTSDKVRICLIKEKHSCKLIRQCFLIIPHLYMTLLFFAAYLPPAACFSICVRVLSRDVERMPFVAQTTS